MTNSCGPRVHTAYGHRHALTESVLARAELLLRHGEAGAALPAFRDALAPARDIGAPLLEARATEGLARCLLPTDPAAGLAHLREAEAIYRRIGARIWLGWRRFGGGKPAPACHSGTRHGREG
ncbi:hypothetical protein [Streptomyces sp. TLI_146]|uniref:hypothetical protein n=1 Tax=Streptomyces sp. TLI_146 TaxID=1938858 RepID=UPI00117F2A29|nr:hypothetical protein [Streptomyces sp. TLI_146]